MSLHIFETLNSTNLFLKQNFDKYADFDVILAHHQTSGYGRFNRNWIDLGNDNIFMSICLKFDNFNDKILSISQFAALILARTFELYSLKPEIKWPNDILIDSKKIAGILAETVILNSEFKGVVLGLGINLVATTQDVSSISQSATSLNLELGYNLDKFVFIDQFIDIFKKYYLLFLSDGFSYFKNDYLSYFNCINQNVTIYNGNVEVNGIIKGVSDLGMLILDVNGIQKEISAGDISFHNN